MTGSTVPAFVKTNSGMILPTVTAKINSAEKYATENTTLVLFVRNVPSPPKIVLTAVPDTTPVTAAFPATETPTVTFLTSPAPMAVRLTIAVQSVPPVKTTPIAVRRQFPVITDVPRPTPAVSAPLVRAIQIATCPINPAITVVRRPIPAASVRPVSLVLRRQTRLAVPMGRNPVPTAAAVPDCAVKGIPILTLVKQGIRKLMNGELMRMCILKFAVVVKLQEIHCVIRVDMCILFTVRLDRHIKRSMNGGTEL